MSVYNTGVVQVKVGSATVTGTATAFNTYAQAGYLFKLTNESAWYEIASVTNASTMTLTARYADSNYETARSESVASTNSATTLYSGTVTNYPVLQSDFVITASNLRFTDDGGGVLTGTPTGSGTINYDTGAWALTFAATFAASVNILASYNSGDTKSAMPYQVVNDYTTNYSFPEIGINDTNFQHIYTKAIRQIDSTLKNLSASTVKATNFVKIGNKYMFEGSVSENSGSVVAAASALVTIASLKGSIYLNDTNLWHFNATNTATINSY